jgi:hypothetical protein
MVRKLAILGLVLGVTAVATMVCAESYTGAIPAPAPTVMPAAAPACVAGACPPPVKVAPPPQKKLTTTIDVQMKYPRPVPPPMIPACGAPPPPIPVAVPMWKFIVPWPPFVYYLPVE